MQPYNKSRLALIPLLLVACLVPKSASAQLAGHNLRGDYGLKSGSQAPVGAYIGLPMVRYGADTIRDRNGDVFATGDFAVGAGLPLVSVVTKAKILGANYGFTVAQPLMNTQVAFPRFDEETGIGGGDIYIVPLSLGWHTSRADFVAGYGFYAPTGGDNQSLDMWSHELQLGGTFYLDEEKNWHVATTSFYEIHTSKSSADLKVGDLLTLEGGLGRSFLKKAASLGVAYTAQWKVTADSGDDFPAQLFRGKNRAYSVGPEFNMPFFAKNQWVGLLGVRYLWDLGVQSAFEGETLLVSLTFAHISK